MLKQLTLAQRIWLLAILSIVIFAATYLVEVLNKREELMAFKQDHIRGEVETAHAVLKGFAERAAAGELSEAEAKEAAKQVVASLRYDSGEYFWINDMTPRVVMHPIKPALNGTPVGDVADKKGKRLYSEFVRVVREQGAGYVDYYWPRPGSDEAVPKLSYVKGFAPWGWVVGTGVYVDDVDQAFRAQLMSRLLMLGTVLLLLLGLSFLICNSIIRPLRRTTRAMHDIAAGDGDLTVRMDADGRDELSELAAGFNAFAEKVQHTVLQMRGIGEHLVSSAEDMAVVTEQANQSLGIHQEETHQVATAVHEMSATVAEVAKNAADAAASVQAVRERALDGQTVVRESVTSINRLAESVDEAAQSIQVLESEVQNIGGILDVIRSIADQTNLLALNAAIEAARAGEHGRGFAVVADEVRTLAQRTQESTEEIQGMIEQLQTGAGKAVSTIRSGREQAEISVTQANTAGEALNVITDEVLKAADMNTQIASATEEQSATVEMINQNVNNINQAFTETAGGADQVARSGVRLKELADDLHRLLGQFKA
ncbi:methyl-accepting chemotaxis protein [Motiliproteus sp. SC1-56]|uniref:methyl-accepting chemotaxis protein n=1 Tax=Motiliproteus sp. SC1-56 TaxID=2799565 RepID=UPI001A90427A|nr:methyl-accepting chemotaxis protein [Motiliproteus sp. SC1-56]